MALLKRLTRSIALIAAAAAATSAVVPQASVDQQKRDAIRHVLATADHASPDWVILQAGTRAAALSAAQVSANADRTVLSLTIDGHVLALVDQTLPQRIVLEVQPAIPAMAAGVAIAREGVIRGGTVDLAQVEPQFVSRIALDLSVPCDISFARTGSGLDVILAPKARGAETVQSDRIDALLAHEQAQVAMRLSTFEEMRHRLDGLYAEHSRFLVQALRNLEQVLHESKLARVQGQLDAVVPAQAGHATADWSTQVRELEDFLREATTQRTQFESEFQAHLERSAAAMAQLTAQSESACERHAAASVASAAMGNFDQLEARLRQSSDAHEAAFAEILSEHSRLMTHLDTSLSSLRDYALSHQQEAQRLLQPLGGVPAPVPAPAPAPAKTTTADVLEAIVHLNQPLKAVDETRPDFNHAPQVVAALDDAATDTPPPPPAKRNAAGVTTEDAVPATSGEAAINSRMQSIFPEIASERPELPEATPAVLGAVNDLDTNSLEETAPSYSGDPLDQLVNIDFRQMELSHVVSILARKAQINVIAGTDITGTVTANLRNVPLRQAMETALRMNGLGMLEEDGIFRIVPYEEAVAARRATRMLYLNNAQADEVKKTLDDVLVGSPDAGLMSISANPSTNVVILSGPSATVDEFEQMIRNLDVAEPTLPTVTRAFRLNYAEPMDIAKIVQSVLTAEVGQVATDDRSRQIIVTDIPIVIEQVAHLITDVDLPVKQVAIEAMVVDAVLTDTAQTGTQWIAEAIRRESRRGELIGNLSDLAVATDLGIGGDAVGTVTFGILSSELNVQATIAAEVSHGNAKLLTNPQVVTIENQLAKISISQEIPYREIRQSEAGGTQTTTSFKEVGTVLEVTPRVTHEDDVIVKIDVKQSDTKGEFEGIPIEDKREAGTTLRARDGQTIFIGGLRKFDDTQTIRKVPLLGDIPVANFFFRSNINGTEVNELLIFLTCHVLQEHVPDLTPYQQMKYDELGGTPLVPTTERDVLGNIAHPGRVREPFWKWRREK